jgi:exosortase
MRQSRSGRWPIAGTTRTIRTECCVPLVIAALLWSRHHDLHRLTQRAALRLAIVAQLCFVAGIAAFLVGGAASESFTLRVSGILILVGLCGILGGPSRLRRYGPALALACCAVPLPYVVFYKISFPLQLLSAQLAAGCLHALGLEVSRSGNIFEVGGQALEVVGACSGIRSMMRCRRSGWWSRWRCASASGAARSWCSRRCRRPCSATCCAWS